MSKILITGICGQIGSYLAELCLKKGDEVYGLVRRVGIEKEDDRYSRIKHILDKITLVPGDIRDYSRMLEIFDKYQFDKCFHLAAQSFVALSFEDNFETMNTNVNGTLNILSVIKNKCPKCRFYFSGSSEMMGKVKEMPQTENTPFHPRSIYGISKVTGFDMTRNFREAYGLFACSGILYNSESERRGSEFVTRKITLGIAKIKHRETNMLILGNILAKRDWSYVGDVVEAIYAMLKQKEPNDYIISNGTTHSIHEFVDLAFKYAKLDYKLIDLHDLSEEQFNIEIEKYKTMPGNYVIQSPKFYRPAEVDILLGDSSRIRKELGWYPKVPFKELVKRMVEHDLNTETFIN